ncbi:12484_t:CDS:2, partial [Funneliformis geosporum]
LADFLVHINAKSCFIPRDRQYCLRQYAYINFDNEDNYDTAFNFQQKPAQYRLKPNPLRPPNSSSDSNGNRSYKPSYIDITRNNNSQTTAKPVTVQNRPPQTNQTPPNQT